MSNIYALFKIPVTDLDWPELSLADIQTASFLLMFALLFTLEACHGYRKNPPRIVRRSYLTNLGVFMANDTLVSLMSLSSLWAVAANFGDGGLLAPLADPLWKTLVSFVLLDLTMYCWHWLNHRHDCLWMFHRVHHSDPCMNVSTAFRMHFAEAVLTTMVKALFVLAMGIDSTVLLSNELVMTLFVMFHHANVRIPGERLLGWLTIVPYLHRAHHSVRREEHDNNYGAVFSLWDRIFGTLVEMEPQEIGLPQAGEPSLVEFLTFRLPKLPRLQERAMLQKMIAEAAYYRAEKRGFAPGYDFADWVEAEKEIRLFHARGRSALSSLFEAR